MPPADITSITSGRSSIDKPTTNVIRFPTNTRHAESEVMGLLRTLASNAAEHGIDPQAVAHPDHELLGLCDQIVMLRNQEEERTAEWRNVKSNDPVWDVAYEDVKRASRAVRKPLLRASKLPAKTAAGIFAKAVAVRRVGNTGSLLGKSLAQDLLACVELREVLWSATGKRS